MADLKDLKDQIEKLKKDYEALTGKPASLFDVKNIDEANRAIRDLNGLLQQSQDFFNATNNGAVGLLATLKKITATWNSQNEAINKANFYNSKLTKIQRQLLDDHRNINKLTESYLKDIKEKLTYQKEDLEYFSKTVIANKLLKNASADDLVTIKQKLIVGEQLTEQEQQRLIRIKNLVPFAKNLTEEEKIQLQTYFEHAKVLDSLLNKTDKRLATEKQIEKSLKTTKGIFGALGSVPFLGKLIDSNDALEKTEKYTRAVHQRTGQLPSQMNTFGVAVKAAGKNLTSNLVNPLTIAVYVAKQLIDAVLRVDTAMVELQRSTGFSDQYLLGFQVKMDMAAKSAGKLNVPFSDIAKQSAIMNKNLGISADIFDEDIIMASTEMVEKMGMAGDQSAKLASYMGLTGEGADKLGQEMVDVVNDFNKTNKNALLAKNVLTDVANVSSTIGARFHFNTTELAKAATNARALGLSLEDMAGVASNLLNFEDSIAAELEAELLTGREINLDQERLLAIQGEYGKLAEKLSNNEEVRLAFQTKNVLIQEAQAKAMGMTLDQYSKVFYQQELNRLGAEKFTTEYGKQTYEQMKQLTIQQEFQKSIQSLAESLTPIVKFFADMLSSTTALSILIGGAMLIGLVKMGTQLAANIALMRISSRLSKIEATNNAIDAAAEGGKSASKIPGVGWLLAAGAIGTILGLLLGKISSGDDVVSPGYGQRTLFGPEGAIALNDKDTVIAGTSLFDGKKGDDVMSSPKGSINMSQFSQPTSTTSTAAPAPAAPTNVYISADGLLSQINAKNNDVSNYAATKMA